MKECIMRLILKDKGGHQDCLLFVDSNLGVERFSKKEGLTEKDGGVLEVVLPGRGQMTCFGKGFAWGTRGRGETIQINYKMNFTQDSCQRFSLHFKSTLRVPSTDCFKSTASQKNAYFSRISFSLDHSSMS